MSEEKRKRAPNLDVPLDLLYELCYKFIHDPHATATSLAEWLQGELEKRLARRKGDVKRGAKKAADIRVNRQQIYPLLKRGTRFFRLMPPANIELEHHLRQMSELRVDFTVASVARDRSTVNHLGEVAADLIIKRIRALRETKKTGRVTLDSAVAEPREASPPICPVGWRPSRRCLR